MKTFWFVLVTSCFFGLPSICNAADRVVNSEGFSETQVDGISSAVVDGVWSNADFWWHCGDYLRNIADDRLVSEAEPHFLEPYYDGGWLLDSLGDKSDAEKYYRLGATRNPNTCYLWFSLGFFYFGSEKDYPRAIKSFQMATKAPDADINDWKMLAHSYERNKQLASAISVWQQLQKSYPDNPVVANNLNKDQAALLASTAAKN